MVPSLFVKRLETMSLLTEVIKNLRFTERARDRHFSISQSHGKFLPGDQKVLFFLLNRIAISDIRFPHTQTLLLYTIKLTKS
jgi:hypothetical protein